jgi:hypothetical protein
LKGSTTRNAPTMRRGYNRSMLRRKLEHSLQFLIF